MACNGVSGSDSEVENGAGCTLWLVGCVYKMPLARAYEWHVKHTTEGTSVVRIASTHVLDIGVALAYQYWRNVGILMCTLAYFHAQMVCCLIISSLLNSDCPQSYESRVRLIVHLIRKSMLWSREASHARIMVFVLSSSLPHCFALSAPLRCRLEPLRGASPN
jgi:hypothetical protein